MDKVNLYNIVADSVASDKALSIMEECEKNLLISIGTKMFGISDNEVLVLDTEENISIFREMMEKYNIEHTITDVSNDHIKNNKKFNSDDLNDEEHAEFKELYDLFLIHHTPVDVVLDRINENGYDNLSDVDKEILKNA